MARSTDPWDSFLSSSGLQVQPHCGFPWLDTLRRWRLGPKGWSLLLPNLEPLTFIFKVGYEQQPRSGVLAGQ